MKKIIFSLAALFAFAFFVTPVFAAPTNHTPTGSNLKLTDCEVTGAPLVNVTYKMINDYDSGFGGVAWANDSINRDLKVYDLGNNSYCAIVRDTGSFITMDSTSPLDTTISISAGITGTLQGGYIGTFNADKFDPQYPTKGSLGTFDLKCTDAYTCPGAFDWPSQYFSNVSNFDQPYWAWNYRAGQNGSMVQASTGYEGNIVNN